MHSFGLCPHKLAYCEGMTQFSRGAIDRLGKRLRNSDSRSDDDVSMYVAWSVGYTAAMHEVQVAVTERAVAAGIHGAVSARIKQIDSMVAKLRRMPTKLSGLEDVAGCRIVVPSTRHADQLVELCETLRISRVRNYQAEPHNGYRAHHLTIRASDGRPVELQIRTEIGDLWANLTERCAALVDPGLKYGGGPSPLREFLDEVADIGHGLDAARAESRIAYDGRRMKTPEGLLQPGDPELASLLERFHRICQDLPSRIEEAQ